MPALTENRGLAVATRLLLHCATRSSARKELTGATHSPAETKGGYCNAMSQENVEIVRAVIDALNREDWEAALKHMDSDFELDFSRAVGPLRGVFKLDQMRAFWDEIFGMWEAVRFEVDEIVEAGEQVATLSTDNYRGRDGIELTVHPCVVWTIRNGRIVHGCFYQEWQEALEALAVSEWGTT
jgi:ketosteroid isomerase-like protein